MSRDDIERIVLKALQDYDGEQWRAVQHVEVVLAKLIADAIVKADMHDDARAQADHDGRG